MVTDQDSPVITGLQDELVHFDISPQAIDPFTNPDELDPMNQPFSLEEFKVALSLCKAKSYPCMDGLAYEIIQGFLDLLLIFMHGLFNEIFHASSFSEAWRETRVHFIPKPGVTGF